MKFITSQLAYLTTDREARANLRALVKYLGFLVALVAVYAVMFHVIKLEVEHERHSWVTGFYWACDEAGAAWHEGACDHRGVRCHCGWAHRTMRG